jgi:hypothetical protein
VRGQYLKIKLLKTKSLLTPPLSSFGGGEGENQIEPRLILVVLFRADVFK